MAFASNFGRILSPTFQPNSQAKVEGDWWLAGGIDPDDCIAAYQPKGATNYDASLINLVNPGTHDATAGKAPDWDASTGWYFDKANSEYLITDIPSAEDMTLAIRVADASKGDAEAAAIGSAYYEGGHINKIFITPKNVSSRIVFGKGAANFSASGLTTGTAVLAGYDCYKDGSKLGTISSSWKDEKPMREIHIGRLNRNMSVEYYGGYILAAAIYSTVLTSEQVAALHTAMNAL
jgi:hypothetical protein